MKNIKELFNIADNMFVKGEEVNVLSVMEKAKEKNLKFSIDDILTYINDRERKMIVCPGVISNFILNYARDIPHKTILDPSAGIGSLILPLSYKLSPDKAVGINSYHVTHKIAVILDEMLDKKNLVDWKNEFTFDALDKLSASFDLITGVILPGKKFTDLSAIDLDKDVINISNDIDYLLMMKSLLKLAIDGTALFVINTQHLYGRESIRLKNILKKHGFYIDSIISLPIHPFQPFSLLKGAIVIIKRTSSLEADFKKIHFAELSLTDNLNNEIIHNIKNKISSETDINKGIAADYFSDKSLNQIISEERIEKISTEFGFNPIRISDFATIEYITDSDFEKKEENVLFFPLTSDGIITGDISKVLFHKNTLIASLNSFQGSNTEISTPEVSQNVLPDSDDETLIDYQSYAKVTLDDNKADITYLVDYSKTFLGKEIVKSLFKGNELTKIDIDDLSKLIIYLPDIETQHKTVQLYKRIKEHRDELSFFEYELWNNPRDIDKLNDNINNFTNTESADNNGEFRFNYLLSKIRDMSDSGWQEILRIGENKFIEFKSSIRWDYRQNQINKILETEIAITISAFMNTKGGTLFIGVDDNANILGLSKDYSTLKKHQQNKDGFSLHINNIISNYLGKEFSEFITLDFRKTIDSSNNEKEICIVIVKESSQPVFIKHNNKEEFYIRLSAASQTLSIKEAYDYIKLHWD